MTASVPTRPSAAPALRTMMLVALGKMLAMRVGYVDGHFIRCAKDFPCCGYQSEIRRATAILQNVQRIFASAAWRTNSVMAAGRRGQRSPRLLAVREPFGGAPPRAR